MRRVIKIGGSLLLRDSLAQTLDDFIDELPPAETLAIVGGGEVIDAIRRLDAQQPLEPTWLHWHCVDLLRISFVWLSQLLPHWRPIETEESFRELNRHTCGADETARRLLCVDSFYRRGETPPLPEDWSTTTDAIAGWLSILVEADELILLKSCDADSGDSISQWAEKGIVDQALVSLSDRLPPCRIVNLASWKDQ